MIFMIIILFVTTIFFGLVSFYALKRINQYEDIMIQFQQIVEIATGKMRQVDSTGHYESDDETGFFFKELKEIQLLLDDVFETEEIEEKDNAESKKEEKG